MLVTRSPLLLLLLCLTFLLSACEEEVLQAEYQRRSGNGTLQSLTPGALQVEGEDARLIPHRPHANADSVTASPPTLKWSAPLQRVSGEKLYPGEIDGYRLYYQSGNEARVRIIVISDPNNTRRELNDFGPGNYRFTITSVDTRGMESVQSPEVMVSVGPDSGAGYTF